ncbi:MAG: hypothetical protein ACO3P9_02255 [Phycisphaerales bacterium]
MKIALLRITALLLATTFAACSNTPPDRRALSLEVASSLDDINAGHRRQLDAATLASIETLERDAAEARLDARATLVDRFDRAAAAPRPVVALIDLWWNAAMLRDSAREGQLREVFGSDADQLQRTAEGTYDKIEELASRYLTQAQLAEMRDKIDLAAENQEILDKTLATSIATASSEPGRSDQGNLFTNLISLPLSPFTAARSVETGVAEVVVQAQEFNRQFSRLPEQSRRQAQRLLDDFYLSPLSRATVENMNAIGEASRALAASAEAMPTRLREEAAVLLEASSTSQERIATTVAEARATAADARATVEEVNAAISNLGEQTASLDGTIREATAAGASWERTADAVERVLAAVERIQGPPPPPDAPPTESSFSFEQIEDSAVRLEAAAVEIQGVLDRVIAILDEGSTRRVETLADRTLKEATASGAELVDAIFWRSLAVVGLAGASLVAFAAVRRGR